MNKTYLPKKGSGMYFLLFCILFSFPCSAMITDDINKAARKGHQFSLSKLIDNGQSVETIDPKTGFTPLLNACYMGQTDAVGLLLLHGARISNQGNAGVTPIYAASFFSHLQTLVLLINNGADVNERNQKPQSDPITLSTPLGYSVATNKLALAHFLVCNGANPTLAAADFITTDSKIYSPFRSGGTQMCRLLLTHHLDPNFCSNGTSIFAHALESGKNETVQDLIAHGASPAQISRQSHLHISPPLLGLALRHFRDRSIFKMLLDRGVSAQESNANNTTALHIATQLDDPIAALSLLAKGALLNEQEKDTGNTPLHYAAQGSFITMAQLLIALGASHTIENTKKETPVNVLSKISCLPDAEPEMQYLHQLLYHGFKHLKNVPARIALMMENNAEMIQEISWAVERYQNIQKELSLPADNNECFIS